MRFETKAVHAGTEPDPTTGAIMTPIYQTSTYVLEAPGVTKDGYDYSRAANPTRHAFEQAIATVENAQYGLAFASGMAATDAIVRLLRPGDHLLAAQSMYGGTYRILTRVYTDFGIQSSFVDMADASTLPAHIQPNTKLIWIETPANPTLNIVDIAAVAAIAKQHGITVVVDNTFASPYLQNPLDLGADIVMHSVTKYIAGHSDVLMGALATNRDDLYERLKFLQFSCGAVAGPMDSFLALRGLKSLHVRMERHCTNAQAIAEYLSRHPKVAHVNYPGLASHPNHAIAQAQMRFPGAMLSFVLKDDTAEAAARVMQRTKVFALAESLGGVESLISHPALMTHASMPPEQRMKVGINDSLTRVSVGIESLDDLLADLEQALA